MRAIEPLWDFPPACEEKPRAPTQTDPELPPMSYGYFTRCAAATLAIDYGQSGAERAEKDADSDDKAREVRRRIPTAPAAIAQTVRAPTGI